MQIEYMTLDHLKAWPGNPKNHDVDSLIESIERFGFTAPPVIDEKTKRLVAGHGRVQALVSLKAAGKYPPVGIQKSGDTWLVPVLRGVSFETEAEAEAYIIADNRLTEKGGWDSKKLTEIFNSLSSVGASLEGSGYTFKDTQEILKEVHNDERPSVGKTPQELKAGFEAADEKQIVLYFEEQGHKAFVDKFEAAKKAFKAETTGATLLQLINFFEEHYVPNTQES